MLIIILSAAICLNQKISLAVIYLQLLELYLILAQIITSAPAKPAPKEKKELKVERPYVWHIVIL
jgi:hypothetical protein